MANDHIDLTMVVSDSEESHALDNTPRKSSQPQPQSQPQSQSQSQSHPQPGSRTSTDQRAVSLQGESSLVRSSTPPRQVKASSIKPTSQDEKMAPQPARSTASSRNAPDATPPSSHHHTSSIHRTPKHHTPRKFEWTTDKVEETLRKFSEEIGTDGAKLTDRLIHMAWKKEAPVQQFTSKKDWFADMKRTPVEASSKSSETIRIKTKVCLLCHLE